MINKKYYMYIKYYQVKNIFDEISRIYKTNYITKNHIILDIL